MEFKNFDANIFEHEIPVGSRLYFGKSASLKREVESIASEILTQNGFNEIVTPYFSHHQHLSVAPTQLLRFSDHANHEVSLRADSTVDVVRIVLRRLKDSEPKRWFYIQPIFKYPSSEFYQIGAELIGEKDLITSVNIAKSLFERLNLKPYLQISHIKIPHIVCELLNLPISIFEHGELEKILNQDKEWLRKLVFVNSIKDIDEILSMVPNELKEPLCEIKELASLSRYENLRIVPLYYSKMRYYDNLFFRFLSGNQILSGGGNYDIEGIKSSGFGVYTDALLENLK
ncbi:ATP phosphoribosyltransferase regulatory subunit [Campylobacter sp. CCUG 57310]|uniref:ATP phosphoribosyltransferase regulatory subunit n=1 Tax=Campylobacter sp. CCUG 57310 TaxID=2517362 RepID=UPI001566CD9B|nr:ATP phosphoribosyltransferase regulatory subunit [Campylobacter sp. CCUG 57310]QKF91520.1 ATP phosphoribosyltransferase HisG(S)Z, hetero-octameric short form, regulatory subunit [Campylobacter sp. CCUG 57310]